MAKERPAAPVPGLTPVGRLLLQAVVCMACWAAAARGQDAGPPRGESVPRRDVVVVTGSFEPIPLEEADRAVTSLELPAERKLLAATAADFLELDPSVDLRQRAPGGVQGDLSIRGSTFGQTLILVDGFRLNDVQTGHHNLDLPVPLESLDRIEVLKGSGSAHYGSDAVGGVVHFLTRTPEASEMVLRLGAGRHGTHQERGVFSIVRPRWSEQITFSRDSSSGFRPNRDWRNLSLLSSTSLDSAAGRSRVTLAWSDRPFGADEFYGDFNSWERTKTWFAAGRQSFGERTSAGFAFRRHTDDFVLYRDRPEVFTNRHSVWSYQAAVRRWEPLGTNTRLHYGVEAFHDAIESNNLGTHSRARAAAYGALDVRALGRFSLTVAGREELHRSADSQFSPTVAAGVWLTPRLRLSGSASRAFRLPTYTDLYYHDPANRGSPDLLPESAWSYEARLDLHAAHRLRGELTFFVRDESNGIDYIRPSPGGIWRAANIQRLRFAGGEAGLSVTAARRHRLEFRYTGLSGTRNAAGGHVSRYVFNYPRHSGVASWEASLPAGFAARSRLGAVERYARDPYAVWDVYIARRGRRLSPFLQLTNLTGTSYEEIMGVAMAGRAFFAGLEVTLK